MLDHPGLDHHDLEKRTSLAQQYRQCRSDTLHLTAPLSEEGCQLQSIPNTSPAKWHLVHSSWFFLRPLFCKHNYLAIAPSTPAMRYCLTATYNAVGEQFSHPHRGLLSRPSLEEIREYRQHIDRHILDGLLVHDDDPSGLITLGIQHEKQHQELLLMDIKHAFHQNPLLPAYQRSVTAEFNKKYPATY